MDGTFTNYIKLSAVSIEILSDIGCDCDCDRELIEKEIIRENTLKKYKFPENRRMKYDTHDEISFKNVETGEMMFGKIGEVDPSEYVTQMSCEYEVFFMNVNGNYEYYGNLHELGTAANILCNAAYLHL